MIKIGGVHFFVLLERLREGQTHWALPEQGVCLQSLTLMDLSRPRSPLLPVKMLVSFPQLSLSLSPHIFSLPSFFIHTKVAPPTSIDLVNGSLLLEPDVPLTPSTNALTFTRGKAFLLCRRFAASRDPLAHCPGQNLYPRHPRKRRPRTISALSEKAMRQHIECELEPRLVATQFLDAFPCTACVNSPNSTSVGGYRGKIAAPS